MELVLGFTVISFVYNMLIAIFYFSKGKVDNEENKIYKILLIVNALTIIFEYLCLILAGQKEAIGDKIQESLHTIIICRIYLAFLVTWMTLFIKYIYTISFEPGTKFVNFCKKPTVKKTLFLLYVIGIVATFILPMYFYHDEKFAYTWGPATDLVVILFSFAIVFALIGFFTNHRKEKLKKFAPIFLFILEILLIVVVRTFNPSIQLVSTFLSITTILMYFTIENPDLKMVNELYKNKSIMEQTYEDKSNFLFEITQALKEPLLNLKNTCDEASDLRKVNDLKESIFKMKGYSKELDFVLNDILDTNNMTNNAVKFINNKYSIERLFDEVVSRINPVIPKNVKFTSSISHNIPTLYGDSIKIKQVIMSLLQNSVKHTKNGFIDFQIDTIERFDAIRLIITVRDSSEGMSIDKINEVLTMSGDLDVRDIEALEQSNINMKLCQKVVKLLGGNMLIKSYEGKGSEILLVIDQKIAENVANIVDMYESYAPYSKSVVVVNQEKQFDNYLKNAFKKNNISASFLLDGNYLIDKIKSGKKYDYIIVGNEMKGINGLSILQELNNIKGFKTPVIIIINENEENLAKHFLDEGFANYILTSKFEEDLDTIVNKY